MEVMMRLYEFGPTRSIRARWTLQRMYARPKAPQRIAEAFKSIRA